MTMTKDIITIDDAKKKQLTPNQLRNKALEELAEEDAKKTGISLAGIVKNDAFFPALAGAAIGYLGGGLGGMLVGAKEYVIGIVPLNILGLARCYASAHDQTKSRESIKERLLFSEMPMATVANGTLSIMCLSLISAGCMNLLGFDVNPWFCAKTGFAYGAFESLRALKASAVLKQKLNARIESLNDEQEYLPGGIDSDQ